MIICGYVKKVIHEKDFNKKSGRYQTMIKGTVGRIVVLIGAMQMFAVPAFAATPKWIEKQGKGIFLFNVAIVLVIIGFAGYIWWKKRNGEGGGDEE